MNFIFVGLIVVAVLAAAFTGTMGEVSTKSLEAATSAVTLALSLAAQMTLWLGLMGVLKEAGVMRSVARAVRPLMVRLFPDVPAEHPAMSAMVMNMAANVLGLGNAATPFGLKAMAELDTLNRRKGVATNAMALFLVINTAGLAVVPNTVVAMRAALGSKDAAGVIVPSLISTVLSTLVAIAICKLLEHRRAFAPERSAELPHDGAGASAEAPAVEAEPSPHSAPSVLRRVVVLAVSLALLGALVRLYLTTPPDTSAGALTRAVSSDWVLPVLMLAIVLVGFGRNVRVYEAFVAAAKEGFTVGVVVLPYLVAILVAVGMVRASGALDAFTRLLAPVSGAIGFPSEALPMALIRPLSGSGATGVMTETMKAHGPDSFVGYLVSLINGSSETTFYVLTLYFGAARVRAARHTLLACISADVIGLAITTAICHLFFGALR